MKRRNFFSTLLGGALGFVGMSRARGEERVADRLRRRLEEHQMEGAQALVNKEHQMILRTTITRDEIERAQRGGAKYFWEKTEKTLRQGFKSNLKMIQRDLGCR